MDKRKKRLFSGLATFCICLGAIFISQSNKIKDLFNMDSVVVNNGESNKIKLAKYSTDGQSLTVVASIDEEVTNRKVSWSLSWNGSNSATVTDYVSTSASSDTLTCTIAFKKAFTTQIILTCTSQSNSSVKATATIDYVGRDFETTLNGTTTSLGTDSTSAQLFRNLTAQELLNYTFYSNKVTNSNGGTLSGIVSFSLVTTKPENISYTNLYLTKNKNLTLSIPVTGDSKIYDILNQAVSERGLSFRSCIANMQNNDVVGFDVNYTIKYNDNTFKTGTTTIFYNFNWNTLEVFADNVTLDDTQIIF